MLYAIRTIRFPAARTLLLLAVTLAFVAAVGCSNKTKPAPTVKPGTEVYKSRVEHVTAAGLNVRSKPSGSASIIGVLHKGDPVEVHQRNDNWIYVTTPWNAQGWVYGAYITGFADIKPTSTKKPASSSTTKTDTLPADTKEKLPDSKTEPAADNKGDGGTMGNIPAPEGSESDLNDIDG